jgi:hypothetical protein
VRLGKNSHFVQIRCFRHNRNLIRLERSRTSAKSLLLWSKSATGGRVNAAQPEDQSPSQEREGATHITFLGGRGWTLCEAPAVNQHERLPRCR